MDTDDLSPLKLDTWVLVYPLFLYEDTIEVCERIYDGREMFDFLNFLRVFLMVLSVYASY